MTEEPGSLSPWRSLVKEEPGGLESVEKSMDRRAWEARLLGVAESGRTK